MNLRIMGSTDLILRWLSILERAGLSGQVYPQRRGGGSRLYVEIDDRKAEEIADKVTATQHRTALSSSKR